MNKNKGFTLVELLVVIAVIGILASTVLVGLGGVRSKSRDARRITELKSLQNGLEIYYAKKQYYPSSPLSTTLVDANIGINKIPKDPLTSNDYLYAVCGSDLTKPQGYVLQAILEGDVTAADSATLPSNCTSVSGLDCVATSKHYCVSVSP